jgi:hypothetical protein
MTVCRSIGTRNRQAKPGIDTLLFNMDARAGAMALGATARGPADAVDVIPLRG